MNWWIDDELMMTMTMMTMTTMMTWKIRRVGIFANVKNNYDENYDELMKWWIDEMMNWWIDELMNWW